ncbi:MAG: response regulator [Ahniella sp.]|nr:response regulator [Ahniella sp.]
MTEPGPAARLESHVFAVLLERAQPLYLQFSSDWGLKSLHGAVAHWRADIEHDQLVDAVRDLFLGVNPDVSGELSSVELAGGRIAHVHWLRGDEGIDVILLDARAEVEQQQLKQQESHEAELASMERGKSIDRLRRVKHELERRQSQLEEANALKTAFLATLSHEFRTPLTAIFGYLHLLEKRLQPDVESQFALRAIRRGATHLFGLSENLLEYGRPEAGEYRLNVVRIDLNLLAEDLRIMFLPLAEEQQLDFSVRIEAVPLDLCLDEIRVKQVLINLVSNAIRYTPRGQVTVLLRWTGKDFEAIVRDSGIGIPSAFMDSVFKPFNQGVPHGSRGAGLGLSISKRLVEQMHGELQLKSNPGEGSEFRVRLPNLVIGRSPAASGSLLGEPGRQWLDGGTALVIDDDPDIRELLRLLLEDLGFGVELCVTANEGFERAIALKPDLVIVDLRLPGLSGNVASFKLRAHGFTGRILALSGASDPESRRGAIAAGADQFLAKPVQIEEFVRAVRAATSRP